MNLSDPLHASMDGQIPTTISERIAIWAIGVSIIGALGWIAWTWPWLAIGWIACGLVCARLFFFLTRACAAFKPIERKR